MSSTQGLRFMGDIKEHWERKGHDVRYEMGASETLADWADLYFIDFWDSSIHHLFNGFKEGKFTSKPTFVCRAVDWDVWQGLVRDQAMVDWVDIALCIAPHIEAKLRSEVNFKNLHMIRCGVDTDKFPLIDRPVGLNVVIPCNEIDWVLKNTLEGLKIVGSAQALIDEKFNVFIKGRWTGQAGGDYYKYVFEDYIKKAGLRVTYVEEDVPDYNEFLEQMDYCIVPSVKEAFSYVTAQCASKGIKPILNSWLGCEDLWPPEWVYLNPAAGSVELVEKFDRQEIRNWVVENRNVKTMLEQIDELLGT